MVSIWWASPARLFEIVAADATGFTPAERFATAVHGSMTISSIR
jgi:hypothetical protein